MKKLMSVKLLALLALCAILILPACGGDKEDTPTETNNTSAESSAAESSAAESAESSANETANSQSADATASWNAYVDLSNNMGSHLYDAIDKYFTAFGSNATFQKPETDADRVDFSNSVLNPGELEKSIDQVINVAKSQTGDLDQAALDVARPLKELWGDMVEMGSYIRTKEYIDDDYAKAHKLHAEILRAYEEVSAAAAVFEEKLFNEEGRVRAEDIKNMRANGLTVLPAMLAYLNSAQAVQDYLYHNEITYQNLDQLNLEEYTEVYSEMASNLKELEKVCENQEQIEKENLFNSGVTNYVEVSRNVKTEAATIIENIQEGKDLSKLSSRSAGTPEQLNEEIDILIRRYNTIIGIQADQ